MKEIYEEIKRTKGEKMFIKDEKGIPFSAKDCKGKNYEIVINMFKDAGFTNIEITQVSDIKIGLLKKEGSVEYATINGDGKFKRKNIFDKKSKVRIVYHTK